MNVNNRNLYFLLIVLFWLCAGRSLAQPGDCYPGFGSSTFNPLRACNPSYLSEEFVFVGRMLYRDTKVTSVKDHPRGTVKTIVAVQTPIKGKLMQEIELFLDWTCYEYVEKGETRIFTAKRIVDGDFKALVSDQWSTSLKDISENDLAEIVKEIRSVAKGTKQPRIVGKLVEYPDPNALSGFWGSYLGTKLGYDPKHSHPLAGIEIAAKAMNENLNRSKRESYETKTNPDGSYQFKDLPRGYYELSAALPDNLHVKVYFYRTVRYGMLYESSFKQIQGQKKYVTVGDGFCSEDVRFNVRPQAK